LQAIDPADILPDDRSFEADLDRTPGQFPQPPVAVWVPLIPHLRLRQCRSPFFSGGMDSPVVRGRNGLPENVEERLVWQLDLQDALLSVCRGVLGPIEHPAE